MHYQLGGSIKEGNEMNGFKIERKSQKAQKNRNRGVLEYRIGLEDWRVSCSEPFYKKRDRGEGEKL